MDLHALVYLEHYLCNVYTGIALIVSHDTCFLNTVCTDIIELQSSINGRTHSSLIQYTGLCYVCMYYVCYVCIYIYINTGDYNTYVNTMDETRINQTKIKENLLVKIEKLKEFIGREGKKYDGMYIYVCICVWCVLFIFVWCVLCICAVCVVYLCGFISNECQYVNLYIVYMLCYVIYFIYVIYMLYILYM